MAWMGESVRPLFSREKNRMLPVPSLPGGLLSQAKVYYIA